MPTLIILYPQPADVEIFDKDYKAHLQLLHEKTGIPDNVTPYKVTKMMTLPSGVPPFYQMFSMPFNSIEELRATMHSPAMQEVGADAHRISSGGAPVMMVGNDD